MKRKRKETNILTIAIPLIQKENIKEYADSQGLNVSEMTRALYSYAIKKGLKLRKYVEVIE